MEMVSAYQFSVSYEKYLHHCISIVICQCYDILILAVGICYLLLLCYLFHTVYQIPVFSRFFKLHAL